MKERSSDGFNLIYPKGSNEISHKSSQEALRYLTEDQPSRNTSLEVRGGSSYQQDEPLSIPSFLLVFPLRPSSGQPPSPPNFVVVPVFQQVEPSSVRLPIRPQVRIPSNSHGPAPLSPHCVAIDIPAPADVQEETVQVEVEEARQVERLLILQPP
nr:hypothetical protein Iba_chr10bCG12880 [Ipomoea batatas]